jgi:hypothetical protein
VVGGFLYRLKKYSKLILEPGLKPCTICSYTGVLI